MTLWFRIRPALRPGLITRDQVEGVSPLRRRSILKAFTSVIGLSGLGLGSRARGQEGTPDGASGIPPVRWNLASIDARDDSLIPDDPTRYTVQFLDVGLVYIGADCNTVSGRYTIDGESIAITDIVSTLVMCSEDSLDQEFLAGLQAATSFAINSDSSDQLALETGPDGHQMLFDASLVGVTWQWEAFAGEETTAPDDPALYWLEFSDDGSLHVRADCNNGRGDARIDGDQIALTVATTRKACAEGSRYDDFMRILNGATSFYIRNGMLYLTTANGSGDALFRALPPDLPQDIPTPDAL